MTSTETLKRAIQIAEQIETLQAGLNQIVGALEGGPVQQPTAVSKTKAPRRGRKGPMLDGGQIPSLFRKKKRTLSAEGRARIVAALKKRWAKAGK